MINAIGSIIVYPKFGTTFLVLLVAKSRIAGWLATIPISKENGILSHLNPINKVAIAVSILIAEAARNIQTPSMEKLCMNPCPERTPIVASNKIRPSC